MAKKLNILFAGHSISVMSGLGYAITSLIKRFYKTKKFNIGYINIMGPCLDGARVKDIWDSDFVSILDNIQLFDAPLLDKERYNNYEEAIQKFEPDIVIAMHDPWFLDQTVYSSFRDRYFLVHYITLEVPIYPEKVFQPTPLSMHNGGRKSIKDMMNDADMLIPVSEMGKNNLLNLGLKPTDPIQLGTEWELAFLDKNNYNKKQVFGVFVEEDNFIFMTLGVNNERKRLDRTLEAFKKFIDKDPLYKEKCRMYVHSELSKSYGGTDIYSLIDANNLNKNLILSNPSQLLYKQDLFRKYKTCDCFVSLTGGEGFGYGFIEAIMHNKPVIYSDYGAHVEFCKDYGLPVKLKDYVNAMGSYMKFGIADIDDAVEKMENVFKKQYKIKTDGFSFVKENYNWEKISNKMIDLILDKYSNIEKNVIKQFSAKRIV